MQISTETHNGHDSMTVFIQRHMSSILRPFADHVDDLHKAVNQLRNKQDETASTVDLHANWIRQHSDLINHLQTDQKRTENDVANLTSDLKKTNAEKAELEADHRATKGRLSALDDHHSDTVNKVQTLQQEVEGINGKMGQVMQTKEKMEESMEKWDLTLDKLGKNLNSLDTAHHETSQVLQTTKKFCEGRSQDLDAFIQAQDVQHRKEQKDLQEVARHVSEVGAHLKLTNQRVQTNADHLKTVNKFIAPLRAQADETATAIKKLQKQEADNSSHLIDLWMRFQSLVSASDVLSKRVDKNEESTQKLMRLQDAVTNLQDKLNKDAAGIASLNRLAEVHAGQIARDESRLSGAERQAASQQDQLTRMKSAFSALESAASAGPQVRPSQDFGSQARRFQDIEARLTKSSTDATNMVARIKAMERDLATAGDQIGKLRTGMDLTQEYWRGLSNGFRETHRTIALDNEMLPPKGAHSVPLPALKGSVVLTSISPSPASAR